MARGRGGSHFAAHCPGGQAGLSGSFSWAHPSRCERPWVVVKPKGMAREQSVNALLPVEAEFQKEKASALRRTGEKLEKALAALEGAERELLMARGPARAVRLERYRVLRKEAELQRWYLMVQREACGIRNNRELDLVYPMPPLVRE